MKRFFVALFASLLVSSNGFCAVDGNYLYDMMRKCDEKGIDIACVYSMAYVTGVIETYQLLTAEGRSPEWGKFICFNDSFKGVNSEQTKDIVYKFLKNTPEERHSTGSFLVIAAMQEHWYCPKE